jgi:hypothetical protein
MPTPATHVWKPSNARTVVLDSFIPVATRILRHAPPPLNFGQPKTPPTLDYQFDISPGAHGDGDAIRST